MGGGGAETLSRSHREGGGSPMALGGHRERERERERETLLGNNGQMRLGFCPPSTLQRPAPSLLVFFFLFIFIFIFIFLVFSFYLFLSVFLFLFFLFSSRASSILAHAPPPLCVPLVCASCDQLAYLPLIYPPTHVRARAHPHTHTCTLSTYARHTRARAP